MANESRHSSFRFRQFEVSQDKCAMKVGTDGVLLGAWAPVEDAQEICDVGTGTGLISLMLAQRTAKNEAHITAIEIDGLAAKQAQMNFNNSLWSEHLSLIHGDATECVCNLPKMDLIVSNPPYFADSLTAPNKSRSQARHESTLGYESLIKIAAINLSEEGRLCMISPTDRSEDIVWFSQLYRLPIIIRTDIATVDGKKPSRTLWMLARHESPIDYSTQFIKDKHGNYSVWFHELTKDFYL